MAGNNQRIQSASKWGKNEKVLCEQNEMLQSRQTVQKLYPGTEMDFQSFTF